MQRWLMVSTWLFQLVLHLFTGNIDTKLDKTQDMYHTETSGFGFLTSLKSQARDRRFKVPPGGLVLDKDYGHKLVATTIYYEAEMAPIPCTEHSFPWHSLRSFRRNLAVRRRLVPQPYKTVSQQRFTKGFLSRKVSVKRSVHSSWFHLIITLIISRQTWLT